jgi:8-oxo-dGTP diphosphatase
MIPVVCGVIIRDGLIFIAKRNKDKSMGGYWEFPGGKVERFEIPQDALFRELKEELNMNVEILEHFKTVKYSYPNITIELISFKCKFINAEYELKDHEDYKWVKPSQLLNFKLALADIPIAHKLILEG